MIHRAQAEVDLSAIAENIKKIRTVAGVPVMAVVKANAYGHGLVPVAKTALAAGAQWLGVALLEEALALREAEISSPILCWLAPPGSDFLGAIHADIDLAVPSIQIYEEIILASQLVGKTARIHIEVDTGMTRGGFLDEWEDFVDLLDRSKEDVEIVGIFSHFARADEPGVEQNADQLKRFMQMSDDLNRIGIEPTLHHLSNSAATFVDASSHFDLVRIGIATYGLTPDLVNLGSSQTLGLRPAMTLKARLHLVKSVPANSYVGYGATAKTDHNTVIGVVAMGYADGIPRIARGAGVLAHGVKAPILGRVSMDQFVVDLGPESPAKAGEWVTVFSSGDDGGYTADDWGAASESINYEIVTRIGERVPRVYLPVTQ
jgi:alanine racemase